MNYLPDLPALISSGMGPGLHWFPEDVPASRLSMVMVGMANSGGGLILIGISPRSGQIHGVSDPDEIQDRIFQAALLSDPPLVLPMAQSQMVDRAQVIVLTIPPGLPHVYGIEGRYLWREGAQTNPLPARRLRQLLLERGAVQFELQIPPGANLSDLDPSKVEAYIEALQLSNEAPEEILLRRSCLRQDRDGQLKPTYAALLLFGRYPQQWLPNATLLAARFASISIMDRFFKQDIAATLPEQIRQADLFVRENTRQVVRLVGLTRQDRPEYPYEAVRELLVNAVAHRDYNIQGDNIHLNIFSDRVEIQSPGGLPGPVNLANLLDARFSRNAVIVQVLSDLGFVERLGYGLDRVVTVMRQNHLRSPFFEETAGSFRVTLYGEPEGQPAREGLVDLSQYRDLELNPRQQMALAYIGHNRRINSREYQDLCPEVHAETLRRDLVDLVGHGVLIKVGDKKATYYILKRD